MYGQKKKPADVKTQPLDEFITQTSNNQAQAAAEMPVQPDKTADDVKADKKEDTGASKRISKPDMADDSDLDKD